MTAPAGSLLRLRALALALPLASCTTIPPEMRAGRDGDTAALLALGPESWKGCKPCAGRSYLTSALGCAAEFGRDAVLKALLERGADVDEACHNKYFRRALNSALGRAARRGRLETVRVLLDHCPDPDIAVNPEGMEAGFKTPLEAAELEGHAAVVDLLKRYPGKEACQQARRVRERRRARAARLEGAQRDGTAGSVPEDANRHAIRAGILLKNAPASLEAGKSAEEVYSRVIAEYEEALDLAPWWADAYFNLALVQEKAGDPRSAMENLTLYLKVKPDAADAAAVKRKLIELEVDAEGK